MRKNCVTCKHDRLHNPICDECYNTSDAPTKWEAAEYYEPDTNADRIRAMSDEELARELALVAGWDRHEYEKAKRIGTEKVMLDWLKQPTEERLCD